jgi:hypothetical protein
MVHGDQSRACLGQILKAAQAAACQCSNEGDRQQTHESAEDTPRSMKCRQASELGSPNAGDGFRRG